MSKTTVIAGDKALNAKEELQAAFRIEQLPAMPHSALNVLQLDNDVAKVNIDDLVRPIEADPGLTTQVLKFLNSAFFGFQNPISSVKQGIALVGIRSVKNFVLWKAVFSLIPKTGDVSFDVKLLWQDSLRRALFARLLISQFKHEDQDLAFAGGLLQDMAIPLLLKKKPQQMSQLIRELKQCPEKRLSDLELASHGWTHADAAEMMCISWKIPEDLRTLLANHTKIDPYIERPMDNPVQLVVSLSALLPTVVSNQWHEEKLLRHYLQTVFPTQPSIMEDTFIQVDQEFDLFSMVLQITKPKISLISMLT
ncbi:MAG: HDOD domain-containing protein [Planctomycetaceae bacterium]|nr:HDOD domain-containing protein [Planctomycetaceae bacterium]